jgi:hypothetical protein
MKSIVVAGACLLIAACATDGGSSRAAADAAAATAPRAGLVAEDAGADAPASQPDVICRTQTRVGSHFSVRECHTRAEWDARRRDDEQAVRDIRDVRTAPTSEPRGAQAQ